MFKKIVTLSLADIKNIYRDPLLFMSILAPLLLTLFIKFVLPFLFEVVRNEYGLDLNTYNSLIYVFLIMFTPMMLGVLGGFLILDERDQDILTYISITPLSKRGYLYFRLISPVIISFSLSIVIFYYIGMDFNIIQLIPVFLIAALEAPIMTLFLGSFANNKVEGLTLSKAMGIMFIAPVVVYFVKSNWQYLVAVFPTFWVSQAFLTMGNKNYLFYIFGGLLIHIMYFYFFVNKFDKKAG